MPLDKHIQLYQDWGLSIIPLQYKDKRPALEWKPYQKERATPQQIEQWFGQNQYNIGIVCGAVSDGFCVLDFDVMENYHRWKTLASEKLGDNVEKLTPIVLTGGGGIHAYLKVKRPVESRKFTNVEVKGEGTYVVAPPSIHPDTGKEYAFLNHGTKYSFIAKIDDLRNIGIDVMQKPEQPRNQPNWVTQGLQGVAKGERDDTCTALAGYFLKKLAPDIVKSILYPFAENCEQPPGEPFTSRDVDKIVDSIWRKESTKGVIYTNNGVNKDTLFQYAPEMRNLALKRDNFVTTSQQDWGFYAKKFDEVMRESGGRVDKRDIAETIGLKATSNTFRVLLQRRKDEGKVRIYRGSHYLIEWINRDYEVTQLDKVTADPMLDIKFALKIDEYASVPPGSVIGFAGMVSGGKTSALLETAELNVFTQPLLVYYWYNEMSEGKLRYRCEDFPLLYEARKADRFFPVRQGNFEFADVLQPDAINLIDYIDRDDEVFLIGADIKKLYSRLNTGIVIFALQKKAHLDLGYGGSMSIKLSNLYITLDKKYESGESMHGVAKIIKCKDWANNDINPCNLQCEYHSGGKHGKLFMDGEWKRKA